MKSEKYNKLLNCIYVIAIIIYTVPRSIDDVEYIHSIFNILKFIFAIIVGILFVIKKFKCNKFSRLVFLYSIFIIISSFLNKQQLIIPLRVYALNIASVISINLLVDSSNNAKFFKFLSKYFMALILISFVQILILYITSLIKNIGIGNVSTILGQDNRIVLYVLMELVLLYFCDCNKKINEKEIFITLGIGLLSTFFCWSIMGVLSILIITFIYIFTKNKNQKKFLNVILIGFIVLSLCVTLFNFNGFFSNNVLGIFGKTTSFKYRGYIWQAAVNELKDSPVNILYGFGFFDTHIFLKTIYPWATNAMTPNHLHNLILNTIFFSGIIGLGIYLSSLYDVIKNITKIKNNRRRKICEAIFASLIVLLFMDTFEYYQIYYILLALLSTIYIKEENSIKEN